MIFITFHVLGCYRLPPLKGISSPRFEESRKIDRFSIFGFRKLGGLPPLKEIFVGSLEPLTSSKAHIGRFINPCWINFYLWLFELCFILSIYRYSMYQLFISIVSFNSNRWVSLQDGLNYYVFHPCDVFDNLFFSSLGWHPLVQTKRQF